MMKIDDALAVCVGIESSVSQKADIFTLCLCSRCERDFIESGCILIKRGWQDVKKPCDFCEKRQGLTFGIFNNGTLPPLP